MDLVNESGGQAGRGYIYISGASSLRGERKLGNIPS